VSENSVVSVAGMPVRPSALAVSMQTSTTLTILVSLSLCHFLNDMN